MLGVIGRRSSISIARQGIRYFSEDLPEAGGYFSRYLDRANQSNSTPTTSSSYEHNAMDLPDPEFDSAGYDNSMRKLKVADDAEDDRPIYDEEDIAFDDTEVDDVRSEFPHQRSTGTRCKGKRQRHGFKAATCQLIDLDDLHFTNLNLLSNFVSDSGTINPRRQTNLCAKCQRQVASTIKQARHFAMIPYIQEWGTVDKTVMLEDVVKGGRHDRKLGVYTPQK